MSRHFEPSRVCVPQRRCSLWAVAASGVAAVLLCAGRAVAYERYNDGCQNCHGAFTSSVSPKGTVFPSNNKHTMHRSASYMATNCSLCHRTGDNNNPYIGLSNGTVNNAGVGCSGCHGQNYGGAIGVSGAGLRAHHAANSVAVCGTCHTNDPAPLPEYVKPPYYGTLDTKAADPCNTAPARLENWSVGDTLGLDNDGDNLYDGADPDCGRVRGDMNCSSTVNFDDINGFVLALIGKGGYDQAYPTCLWLNADCNSDGLVNFDDINAFVSLLVGG